MSHGGGKTAWIFDPPLRSLKLTLRGADQDESFHLDLPHMQLGLCSDLPFRPGCTSPHPCCILGEAP